jgi:glucosamine-phosphate N-acetyltransferase
MEETSEAVGYHNIYAIRQIKKIDIDQGGFLETLQYLSSNPITDKKRAHSILKEINSNPLHRIFVAVLSSQSNTTIIGCATLLVEPKFIYFGGRVGHIEDVVVRSGYRKRGVGKRLVTRLTNVAAKMHCVKVILDCSDENMRFYQKLGYQYRDNCMCIKF